MHFSPWNVHAAHSQLNHDSRLTMVTSMCCVARVQTDSAVQRLGWGTDARDEMARSWSESGISGASQAAPIPRPCPRSDGPGPWWCAASFADEPASQRPQPNHLSASHSHLTRSLARTHAAFFLPSSNPAAAAAAAAQLRRRHITGSPPLSSSDRKGTGAGRRGGASGGGGMSLFGLGRWARAVPKLSPPPPPLPLPSVPTTILLVPDLPPPKRASSPRNSRPTRPLDWRGVNLEIHPD
jgi:hypothetical protein